MNARTQRPRRARVAFSISRSHLTLLGTGAVLSGAALFLGGYWVGGQGRSSAPVLEKKQSTPARVAVAKVAPPVVPPPVERTDSAETAERPPPASTVEAEVAPEPEAEPPLPIKTKAPVGRHGIQLGAFEDRAEALAFVESHRTSLSKWPIHVLEKRLPRGTWYRVRVGAWIKKRKAERARRNLPAALAGASMVVRYR